MNTTFNHLPCELQEKIYLMKHQLEMKDVLDHMKTWMEHKPPTKPPNFKLFRIVVYMNNIQDDGLLLNNRFLTIISVENHIINIKTYKLSQLKNECKINKVKVSGNKRELIQRLIKLP